MEQSTKFKEAVRVIIEEIRKETKNAELDSIEFQFKEESNKAIADKSADSFHHILGGVCRWDPVRRRVVCTPW